MEWNGLLNFLVNRSRVRLACACGVAGAWRRYDPGRGLGDPWHSAESGWPFALDLGPPPPKPKH